MVFEKPKPRKQSDNSSPKLSNEKRPIPNNSGGGNQSGNRGGGNPPPNKSGGNNQPPLPSCWLLGEEPPIDNTAGFPEYLRWMRQFNPDDPYRDPTKLQILQKAEEKPNYQKRLEILNKRTKLIAGEKNCFKFEGTWRVRVGGHRGPENILLPAFDNLGIPFIPASTLRGVARTQAIRQFMVEYKCDWQAAEKKIEKWFGGLKAEKADQAGKVVFLDAYPIPNQAGQVSLMVDMANNIWKWQNNRLEYSPNPNSFLSLQKPTFLIGVKLIAGCQDAEILDKVKTWLKQGLQAGIGSQVNTGYGEFSLVGEGKPQSTNEFFRVEFDLEGQLIHGQQKFTQLNKRGQPYAEVRPTAFKSMLRYWFRAFALGVLPVDKVKTLESEIFGGINLPKSKWGYLQVNILERKSNSKNIRKQEGILVLGLSPSVEENKKDNVENLLKNLTWLMFHLGGIGQGARRPLHKRSSNPIYRGCKLNPDRDQDIFWDLPEDIKSFAHLFRKRLTDFHQSLSEIVNGQDICPLNEPLPGIEPNRETWEESINKYCRIMVFRSDHEKFEKPYSLSILHSRESNRDKREKDNYDINLCGNVNKYTENEKAINPFPSPVWIVDLDYYQVVTIFGVIADPRKQYLKYLKSRTAKENYLILWPQPKK